MFNAQARAVEAIEKNPGKYAHYLTRETGGLLKPEELQTWRLLHAPLERVVVEEMAGAELG